VTRAYRREAAGELERAVQTVVADCLAVRAGERVLVIADPDTRRLGSALMEGVRAATSDAALVIVPPDPARGSEPPLPVAAALAACDVFLAPCLPSLSHTTARKAATERGARGASMPGVTSDMLARLMGGGFEPITRRSRAVAELLTEARQAHITCPLGTDIRFELTGRGGISDDGDLRDRGAFGNLPCGEAFIAPTGGEGRVVVSSIATLGVPDDPVELVVRDGRLIAAGGAAGDRLVEMLTVHGEPGRNLAELGVGTNDRATMTGNVLEDEKILGTVHVAFGASSTIGGTVTVPVHIDAVVLEPTMIADATTVVDAGRFVL
jgi:leucyl aminopeptidase (aminopeptidase T)